MLITPIYAPQKRSTNTLPECRCACPRSAVEVISDCTVMLVLRPIQSPLILFLLPLKLPSPRIDLFPHSSAVMPIED